MSDYHVHLHPHSPLPGSPPMGEYPAGYIDSFVEAAAARGVTELGFTEHLYRCVEAADALGTWWTREANLRLRAEFEEMIINERNLSMARYVDVVLDAKARGLPVKLGLEVDFQPGTEAAILDLIAPYPWDFLVGSVHWIEGWDFMHSGAAEELERRGVELAWRQYFALETQLASAGMVDVLAHSDVIKLTGLRPEPAVIEKLYGPLVLAAAASGVAVEVSSSGLRRPVMEAYPSPRLLTMFNAAGVPITLASDAHTPDMAGWRHDEVVAAARAAGYSEHLRFEGRRRVPRAFD